MKMPWLRATWQQLLSADKQGRLGHAIAINWNPQLGSDRLIEQFAHWLLCQARSQSSRACGMCKSCQLSASGHHPDLIEFGHDASQSIGIDDVRSIQHKLNQTSHQQGEKVVVLVNAQLLTTAAANALLKTLEEPPGATTVIVASDAWQRLLPTIRSRLQYYPLHAPGVTDLAQWLSQQGRQQVTAQESLREWCEKPLAALGALQAGELHNDPNELYAMIRQASLPATYTSVAQIIGVISQLEGVIRDTLWLSQGGDLQACRHSQLCEQLGLSQRCVENPELLGALSNLQAQGIRVRQLLNGPKGLNSAVLMQDLLTRWQQVTWPTPGNRSMSR